MYRYLSLVSRLNSVRNVVVKFHPPVLSRQLSTTHTLRKDLQNVEEPKTEKNSENTSGKKQQGSWYQRVTVQGILSMKDVFDILVYGTFAVAIYYAYKNYSTIKEYRKAIDANLIEVEDFKHKFYSIKEFIIPEFIVNKLQDLKSFEVRKSDVWVASFPKSGTTWVQELVCLIESDADFEKVKSKSIEERSPFFEYPSPGLKIINKMESPRIIKTHMPIELLPESVETNSKVIYVLRNPKDVTISFFYFVQMSTESGYKGGLTEFIKLFKDGKVPYGPWWKHVDGYTSKKNVHIIHYEDLHTRPKETLTDLCKFLGKEIDDKKLESIEKWCSFDNMKKNPMVNYEWNKVMGLYRKDGYFFRKGKIGDWLHHFSTTQSKDYDLILEKNLKYRTELDYGISSSDLNKIYKASDGIIDGKEAENKV